MASSPEDICDQALILLGFSPMSGTVASPTAGVDRDLACAELYEQTRDATVEAVEWNEATVRDTVYAYTEPAGTLTPGAGALTVGTTGVSFTASGTPFVDTATDAGKTLEGDGVAGKALITTISSTSVALATITEAFSALTAIATGSWRLYLSAPDWGFSRRIAMPSDAVRVFHVRHGRSNVIRWRREGDFLVTDESSLDILYLKQLTTEADMSARLVEAIVYHMAAKLCEAGLGNAAKADRFWNLYAAKLKGAKGRDMTEGSHPRLYSSSGSLVDARRT